MYYSIFQLKKDEDILYEFMDYDYAKYHGFSLKDYEEVFTGVIDDETVNKLQGKGAILEHLFIKFNSDERPINFKGHSLSMSDVIRLGKDIFYCDRIGWIKI